MLIIFNDMKSKSTVGMVLKMRRYINLWSTYKTAVVLYSA